MWFNVKEILPKEWEFIKLTSSYLTTILYRAFVGLVSIIFAGTISQAHLNGVGLTTTLFTLVAYPFSRGYAYTFETFGPQVYGSSNPGELTTCLMKCLLQGGILHLLVLGPYFNLVYIIDMLPDSGLNVVASGGATDFRNVAVTYLRMTTLIEVFDYAITLISTYFAVLGKIKFIFVVSLMVASMHLLANYIFVSVLGLGVEGIGLAAIISRLIGLIFSVCVCILNIKKGNFPWNGFSTKIFIGWKPMIKLGLPAAILMFVQISLIEISTFCSQFVNLATFSALIITLQLYYLLFLPPYAVSFAASNLIGGALARGNVNDVKQYMLLTLTNAILAAVPVALITYFLRGSLAGIFSKDHVVIDLICQNFWLISAGAINQNLMITINHGILTAFGEQGYTAITLTISSLFVCLPFVLATIFLTEWGMIGILLGWVMNDAILLTTGLMKIWKADIMTEIEKSLLRVEKSTYGSLDTHEENRGLKNPVFKDDMERNTDKFHTEHSFETDSSKKDRGEKKLIMDTRSAADFDGVNSMDAKTVLKVFMFSAIVFIMLASISFIRDYK